MLDRHVLPDGIDPSSVKIVGEEEASKDRWFVRPREHGVIESETREPGQEDLAPRRAALGPLTVSSLSGVFSGVRLDGAFYQTFYGANNANDAPWAGNDPSPNNWDRFVAHAGKEVSTVHWGSSGSRLPTTGESDDFFDGSSCPAAYAENRDVLSNFSISASAQEMADLAANTDVRGALTKVDYFAARVAARNRPMILRPFWEMNGNWGYPWQTGQGTSAATYVAAWRTLYTRINAIANCVSFFWCPNIYDYSVPNPTSWFPGVPYLEAVGCDGYNKNSNATPASMFDTMLALAISLAPGLPFVIGETGCETPTLYTGGKSQWISDLFAWIADNPEVAMFSWFNEFGDPEWPHIERGNVLGTFGGETQLAFKNGLANSLYLANVTDTTTQPSGGKVQWPTRSGATSGGGGTGTGGGSSGGGSGGTSGGSTTSDGFVIGDAEFIAVVAHT